LLAATARKLALSRSQLIAVELCGSPGGGPGKTCAYRARHLRRYAAKKERGKMGILRLALGFFILSSTAAWAEGRWGLTAYASGAPSYNAIGITYHCTEKIAIRPEVSLTSIHVLRTDSLGVTHQSYEYSATVYNSFLLFFRPNSQVRPYTGLRLSINSDDWSKEQTMFSLAVPLGIDYRILKKLSIFVQLAIAGYVSFQEAPLNSYGAEDEIQIDYGTEPSQLGITLYF